MLDHTDLLIPGSDGSRFNKVNKGDQRTKLTAVTTNRVSEPRIPAFDGESLANKRQHTPTALHTSPVKTGRSH